jgi:hypothetical protein
LKCGAARSASTCVPDTGFDAALASDDPTSEKTGSAAVTAAAIADFEIRMSELLFSRHEDSCEALAAINRDFRDVLHPKNGPPYIWNRGAAASKKFRAEHALD